MNAPFGSAGMAGRRARREVTDVPERKPEDKSLDKLLNVRKHRLDRLERERLAARQAWRELRRELREQKTRWRDAVQAYKDYWQQARQDFFSMASTGGQFRKAKFVYERMKRDAAEMHAECIVIVGRSKDSKTGFFEARQRVLEANRQQEKLGILRDEMRAMTAQSEM